MKRDEKRFSQLPGTSKRGRGASGEKRGKRGRERGNGK